MEEVKIQKSKPKVKTMIEIQKSKFEIQKGCLTKRLLFTEATIFDF